MLRTCHHGSAIIWSLGKFSSKMPRVTYRLPSTEEPDGAGGLSNLKGEDTNLTAGGIEGHERRGEAVLLCDSVELLCAWV